MTLVLAGERPDSAGFRPLNAIAAWFARARAQRAQRTALNYLLGLEQHRLSDLGIERSDLFDVIAAPQGTRLLAERRDRRMSI